MTAPEDAGVRIHVEEHGRGPAVVLLHGFTGSASAWPARCVRALAEEHRLLLADLPGHGRSVDGVGDAAPDLAATVDAVTGALDEAGVGEATWIGYSMGGRVALGAAILRPERVERLVLESASPGLRTSVERVRRRHADEALARRIETEGMEAFVDAWLSAPLFASMRRLPPSVRRTDRLQRLENLEAGLAASLRSMGTGVQPSFWDRLPEIRAPTLLVTGLLDAKFTALGAEMARSIPGARHVIVADAGHRVHLERPRPWLAAIRDFLDG